MRGRRAHQRDVARYETAMKAAGVTYTMYTYPGTQHSFHNNSTPRYQEAAAKLAWEVLQEESGLSKE